MFWKTASVRAVWFIPRTTSNAGKRTLFLTPEAKSVLARRITLARDGNLFPALSGSQVRNLSKNHEKALAACGLVFRIYDLRHTFATRFYAVTKDIVALARILGQQGSENSNAVRTRHRRRRQGGHGAICGDRRPQAGGGQLTSVVFGACPARTCRSWP